MSMETKDLSLFEQMGGTYTEKDGFLYPNLSMEQESEQITVGKYGLLWISYMKETYPDRYRHHIRMGQLYSKAAEVNEEACIPKRWNRALSRRMLLWWRLSMIIMKDILPRKTIPILKAGKRKMLLQTGWCRQWSRSCFPTFRHLQPCIRCSSRLSFRRDCRLEG